MSVAEVGGAVVRELWRVADRVQEAGFSLDPLDLAQNLARLGELVDAVGRAVAEPPPGESAQIEAAAARWRLVAEQLDRHAADLEHLDVPAVWTGPAGRACTRTATALADRFAAAVPLARRATHALLTYADEVAGARRRHDDAGGHLRAAARQLGPCAPWAIAGMISGVLEELQAALRAAHEAHEHADAAARTCAAQLRAVAHGMPFPGGAVPGLSSFDLLTLGVAEGRRPLVGDVGRRAAERYADLGQGAREVVDDLLADAPTVEHRAWVLAAFAQGASVETLANFADRIGGLGTEDLGRGLDPTRDDVHLVQATPTTCGSASLAVARMLDDPVFALRVLTGYDAETGTTDGRTAAERFAEVEQEVKARTNDTVGEHGRTLPWPGALGTPPWGAAEEMNGAAGGSGYRVHLVDSDSPSDRQQAYDALERTVATGRPAPVYVGDGVSPRHVVLVVGRDTDGLQVYEPGAGEVVSVNEDAFVRGDVDLGGWARPWAVVTP